LVQAVLA